MQDDLRWMTGDLEEHTKDVILESGIIAVARRVLKIEDLGEAMEKTAWSSFKEELADCLRKWEEMAGESPPSPSVLFCLEPSSTPV